MSSLIYQDQAFSFPSGAVSDSPNRMQTAKAGISPQPGQRDPKDELQHVGMEFQRSVTAWVHLNEPAFKRGYCIKAIPGLGMSLALSLFIVPTPLGSSHITKSAIAAPKVAIAKQEPPAPSQQAAETPQPAETPAPVPQQAPTPPPAQDTSCVTGYFTGDPNEDFIIRYESGGNSCATNYLGCFGLMQACPGSPLRVTCGGNPACQLDWFWKYKVINDPKYGSWAAVVAHEHAYGWW